MSLIRSTIIANLCPNMIQFDALHFNEGRSKEVTSFFWRSVGVVFMKRIPCYTGKYSFNRKLCGTNKKHLWKRNIKLPEIFSMYIFPLATDFRNYHIFISSFVQSMSFKCLVNVQFQSCQSIIFLNKKGSDFAFSCPVIHSAYLCFQCFQNI